MNILLVVTGSISAYKSVDIARGLVNRGHGVKVILSVGAIEFVNPKIFNYLGILDTYLSTDDFNNQKGVLHIELSKWCDTFVLCPASANTISKLATGRCDDLLSSVYLSLPEDKIKLIFPAMNVHMLNNSITQKNIKILREQMNTVIIDPNSGLLACGDTGDGKLPKVEEICELIPTFTNKFVDKMVIITAGATISNIDDIRYVTNPAKGGTSYILAKKYLSEGYKVLVIKGKYVIPEFEYLEKHSRYISETVVSTQDLLSCMKTHCANGSDFNIFISPMAVSDIEFEYKSGKIKKSDMNGKFNFKQAPDVLAYVLNHKQEKHTIVGFVAEAKMTEEVIKEKMKRKPVDLLVANEVNSGLTGSDKKGFGTREGNYKLVYTANRYMVSSRREEGFRIDEYVNLSKQSLAYKIFELVESLSF